MFSIEFKTLSARPKIHVNTIHYQEYNPFLLS
jgi:hypothetical protein